jgi:hypothetical protein
MSHRDSEMTDYILEASIDGITKSYLAAKSKNYSAIKERVEMLVQERFLAELADKNRNYIAYRTTKKGLQHLLANRSLHGVSIAAVEA